MSRHVTELVDKSRYKGWKIYTLQIDLQREAQQNGEGMSDQAPIQNV